MPSANLPWMMQPKLGIIAGGGRLPSILIQQCLRQSRDFVVVALKGQCAPETVAGYTHIWVRLGAAGQALKYLQDNEVAEIIMAGAVVRPSATDLRPDMWTAKFLATSGAYYKGDDGLLRSIIRHLERTAGFRVIDVAELAPTLVAEEGCWTRVAPSSDDMSNIDVGFAAAKDLGAKDLGQGVVVANGRVMAKEGRAGTDAMLAGLPINTASEPHGVLVKTLKPNQDRRADLPTIGPGTINAVIAAGLRGIAIEAGGSLIIDREAMLKTADEAGLFVIGVHPAPSESTPLVYIIAGEPSADALGASLMSALKAETSGKIQFAGVGGPAMARQGQNSLFPMEDLAVMGLAEIVPRIPQLRRRILQTVADVIATEPDVVVTIDSPDFNFRVGTRLKGKGLPIVHFVAPSVWAWRPGRAQKIARFLDHLLVLLPFEPPYFERVGLSTTYVGHPVLESGADKGDGAEFRKKYGIGSDEVVVLTLPGSRRGEVTRHLPVFEETLSSLSSTCENFRHITVTAPSCRSLVATAAAGSPIETMIIDNPEDKIDAFAAADVALAASGTVALELALAGTPAIIAYRINPLTAWLVKKVVSVRYANLINIILDRMAIPEFLSPDCRAELIGPALANLIQNATARDAQKAAYVDALGALGLGGEPASQRAAKAILSVSGLNGNGAT